MNEEAIGVIEELKQAYPDKFTTENRVFGRIHRGDVIFTPSILHCYTDARLRS